MVTTTVATTTAMVTTATTEPSALSTIINEAMGARHLASISFPFDPVPASRPRVTRWGVYYSKTYTSWRKLAEKHLKPGSLHLQATERLLVVISAVSKRAKTSKLVIPRGDLDNTAKGPMDVVTKATGWWHDDNQITTLLTCKRFAARDEQPRTDIEIYLLP